MLLQGTPGPNLTRSWSALEVLAETRIAEQLDQIAACQDEVEDVATVRVLDLLQVALQITENSTTAISGTAIWPACAECSPRPPSIDRVGSEGAS